MIPYFIQQWCHSDICEGLEFTQLSKTFAWPHHQTKMYMYVRNIEYVSLFSIGCFFMQDHVDVNAHVLIPTNHLIVSKCHCEK
jgi:hypothetical protein